MTLTDKVVKRLSIYRRLLNAARSEGAECVYSHELAGMAGVTASQVRRDLMTIGYSGSPARGYAIDGLLERIRSCLDDPEGERIALVGMGHLGKAISSFFTGRRPKLSIVALFDTDPEKVNRVVHGSRVYPMEQLEALIAERDIGIGIVAVPGSAAQDVADRLVRAGVRGILNFAPARLRVPPNVYVEDLDITVSLETVALFARQGRRRNGIRDDAKRKEASR